MTGISVCHRNNWSTVQNEVKIMMWLEMTESFRNYLIKNQFEWENKQITTCAHIIQDAHYHYHYCVSWSRWRLPKVLKFNVTNPNSEKTPQTYTHTMLSLISRNLFWFLSRLILVDTDCNQCDRFVVRISYCSKPAIVGNRQLTRSAISHMIDRNKFTKKKEQFRQTSDSVQHNANSTLIA